MKAIRAMALIGILLPIGMGIYGAIGVSANKEFVIEGVEKLSAKARGCPYRLSLKEVTTVFVDSFCVSEEFALQHSAGQSIQLTGRQSRFGFRFMNVS